jgi:hypothetical protein
MNEWYLIDQCNDALARGPCGIELTANMVHSAVLRRVQGCEAVHLYLGIRYWSTSDRGVLAEMMQQLTRAGHAVTVHGLGPNKFLRNELLKLAPETVFIDD